MSKVSFENLRCLVLNKNYVPCNLIPLETIRVRDAVTRVFGGSCDVVSEFDLEIKTPNKERIIKWPSIIIRKDNKMVKPRLKMTPENLYYRDHCVCQYCEKPLTMKEYTRDHVIPESLGGKSGWDNIVISCTSCNSRKDNNMPVGEFKPKRMPYKPTYGQMVSIRKKFPLLIDSPDWMDYIGDWDGPVEVRAH